ncbi:hypothetical protein B0T22DRAFT_499480 [Podospora appendiculata]|uniref:Uncharacterized protein n=1 Tax=Podospora appendiculata TaxID=314037 RepID=A0AAE0XCQ3_9PEZI|nr:hypothetical protein B0T22DRAFT_499480 [Podospora appendiculata]
MNPLLPLANHQFNPFEPHPELDGVDVGDLQSKDWSNGSHPFGVFSSKGMAAPQIMRPAQARCEAAERAARLLAKHCLLHAILDRHEAVIQKRWYKKTRAQRLAILLKAWPGMPTTHRPDFAAFRQNATRMNSLAVQLRGSFIWPYINQEDLANPKTLPLLLNARGRNHPTVFAAADGEAMHLGKVSMAIVPIFLNEHVMMLNGVTRDADYGKLINWDEHDDAFDWMDTRKQFLPGEGLLILEAQERLLDFLVQCCRQVLHDIPSDQLVSDAYPSQPEPPLKDTSAAIGFTSLAVMAEEAPYRVPQDLDLEKIETLLAARKALAEDHAWALREDPGYFADHVLEMRDHRQEMLKDVHGNVHPTLKTPHEGILWNRVIGSVLLEAQFQLELFSELHRQAQQLHALQRQYAAQISPREDLPEPYLAAILKFRHYLNQMAKGPTNQLKIAFVASPPMRAFFIRDVPISASSSKINTRSLPGLKMDKVTGQLLWLLWTLWEDGYDLFLCRMPAVVDELDRLLKAEPRARELVSPYTARLIGELSIVAECLRQLDIYQPWANGFENALVHREDAIKREFAERTASEARVLAALHEDNVAVLRPFGDPSDNKFEYPVGKRLNKANVDKLRAAEAHLDTFWAKADELIRAKAGSQNGTALQRLLSQPRLLQRTPEWVEPAAGAKANLGRTAAASSDALSEQLSTVHLGPEPPSARREVLAAEPAKTKAKTRGAPRTPSVPDVHEADPRPVEPQPRFTVDARALKVFRIIFFDPTANTSPGEVAWLDFVHALKATGFAAQKLYGSVWHFQPTSLDVERSIQFHEPHPRNKIPFLIARRHGRRLTRAYGWHGDMFLLQSK